MNYYNEHDPKAAAWLRELIACGHIPAGVVDERDIQQVKYDELTNYTQCHFFAGIGGWPLALRLAGWPDTLPVWTGSCPCQPFSAAGQRKGESDERHLWPDFRRLIEAGKPTVAFGEQVASKAGREWLAGIRTDLEALAYEVGAADLCAAGVNAPHIRQRIYWVADATSTRPLPSAPAGIHRGEEGAGARNGEPKRHGATGSMADANGGNSSAEGLQCGGEYGLQQASGGSGGMANPHLVNDDRAGCGAGDDGRKQRSEEAIRRVGDRSRMADNQGERRNRSTGMQGQNWRPIAETSGRPWNQYELLQCTDGKARRIEPGTFPLAHGIPGRVGLLRGYGNAIVPQNAAEFVMAWRDVFFPNSDSATKKL